MAAKTPNTKNFGNPFLSNVSNLNSTTGFKFLSGSTKGSEETVEWEDGNTYPLIRVEISSDSHPFYTGKVKLVDTAGRVDKFMNKYKKFAKN